MVKSHHKVNQSTASKHVKDAKIPDGGEVYLNAELDGDLRGEPNDFPLCVDLDGTLVRSDSFFESFIKLVQRNPIFLLYGLFWALQGKTIFKYQVFKRVRVDVLHLPYNQSLINFLENEFIKGRQLILVTGALRPVARQVARHIGIFSEVFATDLNTNLTGQTKANFLVRQFGLKKFDYIGNSLEDIPVWQFANRAYAVNASRLTLAVARNFCGPLSPLDVQPSTLKLMAQSLRVHQWVKNFLVFIPIALADKLGTLPFVQALIAFFSFSCMASAGYIINDIMDIEADRHHPYKSARVFASGRVSIKAGLLGIPLLILASLALSYYLNAAFSAIVTVYFITTMTYSIFLKKIELVDVFVLASLYSLRLYAGGAATGTYISSWLLAFTTFFFLSLALIKRCSELSAKMVDEHHKDAKVRGYYGIDYRLLQSLGTVSGYISILVLALYINIEMTTRHYYFPEALWGVVFLLTFWISRMWLISNRGKMHYDPIIFAFRDHITRVIIIFMVIFMLIAKGI